MNDKNSKVKKFFIALGILFSLLLIIIGRIKTKRMIDLKIRMYELDCGKVPLSDLKHYADLVNYEEK